MKSLLIACIIISLHSFNIFAQTVVESSDGVSLTIESSDRIITIGGAVTETVYALGLGDNVVATDASSTYPRQVFQLPRVPYVRNLTAEGILALAPDLILASSDANPASAIQQIRNAGTNMLLIKEQESLEGANNKLAVIGKALNAEEKANELIATNNALFAKADSIKSTLNTSPKVMFVLAVNGTSNFMIAGKNTGAAKMIELAGGENAFNSFSGYKPASIESIIAANADYVLVMQSRFDEISIGLKKTPGINSISAVTNNKIIGMDGNYLLGFGPRFGSAILSLMQKIHPNLNI